VVTQIRNCLDPWLGIPQWKQGQGRFTLNYRFMTEIEPIVTRKVKIEINTREHFAVMPTIKKIFTVESEWFSGQAEVITYTIEELLATKLRALYQRKKGRDLYDFWYAYLQIPNLNNKLIIQIFNHYMENEKAFVSRAEFEENLYLKQKSAVFNSDIRPLLAAEHANKYDPAQAYNILFTEFINNFNGQAWKGR
jgi:predicted nucleotidyltransferase component of viral defense system